MELIGDNIYLREIEISDTEDIIRWRNQEEVRKFFINQQPFTRQGHLDWFHNMIQTGKAVQFIITNKNDNKSIGSVYLRDIDYDHSKCEYGIFIGEPDYKGCGIGTQAAKLTIKYAFEVLQLNRIFLRVFADNERAIHSYQKAGFKLEGCFRQDVFVNQKFKDVIYMAILKKEL